MSAVIEFSMRVRPGHFEATRDAYAHLVEEVEHEVSGTRLIMVVGEPDSGLVRGIGLYDEAVVAESLASTGFFARFVDAVQPHLAGPPERVEFAVEGLMAHPIVGPVLDDAVVAEVTYRVKLGHVEEFWRRYRDVCDGWMDAVPDTRLLLLTADRASGLARAFLLYGHKEVADAAPTMPALVEFWQWAEQHLSAPVERVEHRLLHLYVAM